MRTHTHVFRDVIMKKHGKKTDALSVLLTRPRRPLYHTDPQSPCMVPSVILSLWFLGDHRSCFIFFLTYWIRFVCPFSPLLGARCWSDWCARLLYLSIYRVSYKLWPIASLCIPRTPVIVVYRKFHTTCNAETEEHETPRLLCVSH